MKSFFESQIWPLRNKLYRLAYLWVKDRDVAEDLLQTVFEKTLNKEEELKRVQNLPGWIVRTLKNESLNHIKQNQRTIRLDGVELFIPEELDESKEKQIEMVLRFMAFLPEKQREIFHLREIEGLTYAEISDYLELPIEQVKVNLHRARRTLRECLTDSKHAK